MSYSSKQHRLLQEFDFTQGEDSEDRQPKTSDKNEQSTKQRCKKLSETRLKSHQKGGVIGFRAD